MFGEPQPLTSSNRSLSTLTPNRNRSISFTQHSSSPRKRPLNNKASSSHILRQSPPLTIAAILSKTYYNVQSHQPESLDWFNVLVAQTIAQLRTDAVADNAILTSLTSVLNGPHKPDFIESISVTEIGLGEEFPIFSNCRVHPVEDEDGHPGGRLQARMDVDLSDFITLGIETTLVLNYPRPRIAVLPVALNVAVVRFSGTFSISFEPASVPTDHIGSSVPNRTPTTLAFSFLPNYTLNLSTRSLLGARSRLQDVPKIAQIIESQLRTWFEDRCVAPRTQQIVVPSLWPRMKNVVEEDGKTASNKIDADLSMSSGLRDPREEALRELEDDLRKDQEVKREWEGLRWRGFGSGSNGTILKTTGNQSPTTREGDTQSWLRNSNSDMEMPGPMPGTLIL